MSDFISNHEKISLQYNTLSCGSERPCQINTVFSDRTYEKIDREGKKMYRQRGNCSPSTLQSDGKSQSNYQENPYVKELERISSNIIHLLHEAEQRTMKVNASCETAQSSNHPHSLDCPWSRDDRTDMWYMAKRNPPKHYRVMPEFSSYASNERSIPLPGPSCETVPKKTSFLDRLVLPHKELHGEENTTGGKSSASGSMRRFYECGRGAQSIGSEKSRDGVSNDMSRQRKDSHNKVERRRRSIINDRINELKSLLPEHLNRGSCQKKGSILEEAIKYIKTLQSYYDKMEQLEQKVRETEEKYKNLNARIERLELRYKIDNSDNGRPDLETSAKINVDGIVPAPVSRENYQSDVTSSMSKNVYTFDQTYVNLSTANSVSNLSLIGDCDMVADDWQFHI